MSGVPEIARRLINGVWQTGVADEGGNGGSQAIRLVDLGVIDLPSVYTDGPTDLCTLGVDEYLAGIRFTDTDVIELDAAPLALGFGTPHSFGWFGFAWLEALSAANIADGGQAIFDTLALAANTYAYSPDAAVLGKRGGSAQMAMVLSTPGPVQVSAFMPSSALGAQPGFGDGARFDAVEAWAEDTVYDDTSAGTPGVTSIPRKAAIVANGTVWTNTGTPGSSASAADEPDFAGNAGGNVSDPNINLDITGVDQGAKHFIVAGDHAASLRNLSGGTVLVQSSTGNDGTYTVVSAVFAAGATTVTVAEAIPDSTVDGQIGGAGDILWTDTEIALPTMGTLHAVAEIWTLS